MSQLTDSFSRAFLNIMPQFGFEDAKFLSEQEWGRKIETPGVIVIIGLVGNLHGNVMYAMEESCARRIAGAMVGMSEPMETFDEMSQSAVSELCNMLAANACIELSQVGVTADISTPTLMYGDFTANASHDKVFLLNMQIADMNFKIYISLTNK